MANINHELFRRTSPKTKLQIINKLSDAEILQLSYESIARMIRETTTKDDYRRILPLTKAAYNHWNAWAQSVEIYKRKIFINFYVQYSNTDRSTNAQLQEFLRYGEFRGEIKSCDHYGNPLTYYYTFGIEDKVNVLRDICVCYINSKNKDKLTA